MAECNRTEVAVRERTSRPGESRCDVIETTNIRQSAVTAFKQVGQFFVVDAEQCEHGGVQVVDVDFVFDCAETEFVGRADDLATANATAREPCRVAVGIVVAALIALHHGRAAEFTGPGDERRVEQPALKGMTGTHIFSRWWRCETSGGAGLLFGAWSSQQNAKSVDGLLLNELNHPKRAIRNACATNQNGRTPEWNKLR